MNDPHGTDIFHDRARGAILLIVLCDPRNLLTVGYSLRDRGVIVLIIFLCDLHNLLTAGYSLRDRGVIVLILLCDLHNLLTVGYPFRGRGACRREARGSPHHPSKSARYVSSKI